MPPLRFVFRPSFVRSCCFVQNDTRILVERGRNDIVVGGEDGELAVWISPDLTANRSFEARLARQIFRRLPPEQTPFRSLKSSILFVPFPRALERFGNSTAERSVGEWGVSPCPYWRALF